MIRESDLFPPLVSSLEKQGWVPYFEIQLSPDDAQKYGTGKARPDAAFTRGDQLLVVEGKLTFSWALLVQAKRWIPMADGIALVGPSVIPTDERREQIAVCRDHYGFGLFEIESGHALQLLKPRWQKRATDVLAGTLSPEHQTHARPGTQGGQFTAQKATYEALARFVSKHPLCTIEEAVSSIHHHYRTKRAAALYLAKAVARGEVPGVKRAWRQRLEATGDTA